MQEPEDIHEIRWVLRRTIQVAKIQNTALGALVGLMVTATLAHRIK